MSFSQKQYHFFPVSVVKDAPAEAHNDALQNYNINEPTLNIHSHGTSILHTRKHFSSGDQEF